MPHTINGKKVLPHTHLGYEHDENGIRELTKEEKILIEELLEAWYNRDSKD